jgi:hypothetical protein
MRLNFLKNIRQDVLSFDKNQKQRIKIEWIYPYCIGIPDNKIDEAQKQKVSAKENRLMFIKLVKRISNTIEIPFTTTINSFVGLNTDMKSKLMELSKQITKRPMSFSQPRH